MPFQQLWLHLTLPKESFPAQTSRELARPADRHSHTDTCTGNRVNRWADYFCFPLPTTTGAINDIPSPPKQTRLCTGGCQEVEKSPLEQYRQPLSTSGLLPPSTPGEAAWGPLSVKALMTFSSSSGCSRKVEGVGGKLGSGLFLESPSLCASQAPLTSLPSQFLGMILNGLVGAGRRMARGAGVGGRGAVSTGLRKYRRSTVRRGLRGKKGGFDSDIPSFRTLFLKIQKVSSILPKAKEQLKESEGPRNGRKILPCVLNLAALTYCSKSNMCFHVCLKFVRLDAISEKLTGHFFSLWPVLCLLRPSPI